MEEIASTVYTLLDDLALSDFRASGTVYTAIDIATGQEVATLHFRPPS